MAVDGDIDMVLFEHRKVDSGLQDRGRSEQHIRDIGPHHRPAPAVREAAAESLEQHAGVVRTNAHLDPVHAVHHFAVDPPRGDPEVHPDLPGPFRGPVEELEGVFHHPVLFEHGPAESGSKLLRAFLLLGNPVFRTEPPQFLQVGNAVISGFAGPDKVQGLDNIAAMVRMGCSTGCDHIQQVAGNDQVGVGTADAPEAVGRDDPARPHGAP